jgi:transforming growth factor-beta-induced protein
MLRRCARVMYLVLAAMVLLASTASAVAAPRGPSIVDVAIAVNSSGPYAGQFDTLIAAVLAANPAVVETLSGNGQFTVFAPTDDAFAQLGLTPETIEALPQDALTQILLYHVVRGRRYAEDVLASDRLRTLQRSFLEQSNGTLIDKLDRSANIIVTDVEASNGVIHAIDSVVLPFQP